MAAECPTASGADVPETTCFALVSYSDSDKDWVLKHLVPNVERDDKIVQLFLKDRDFEPDVSKLDAYSEIARNCDKIVVLLSRSYVRNGACVWELDQALSSGHRLVPIVLSDCDVPQTLRPFGPLVYRAGAGDGDFWERLRDTITGKTKDPSFARGRTKTFPKLPTVLTPRTADVSAVCGMVREARVSLSPMTSAGDRTHALPPMTSAGYRTHALPPMTSAGGGAQHVVGIWGMGGSGKTVLAVLVAQALAQEDRREVFWMTSGRRNSVLENLVDLFADMTCSYLPFTELSDIISAIRHHTHDKDYVIVLDDVRNVEHAEDIIDAMAGRCQVLVTSRDVQVFRALQVSQVHNLKTFEKRESETLLLKKIGLSYALDPFDERRVMVDVILQACGGLPLAISVGAATIQNSEDVNVWRSTARALKSHGPSTKEGTGNRHVSNVLKSFAVSLNALTPALQRRFVLCGVFPDNVDIPMDTLAMLWRTECTNLSEVESQRSAESLIQRSLLLEGRKPSTYRLHDIAQDIARPKLGDEEPSVHRRLIASYRAKLGRSLEDCWDDGYFFQHISYHFKQAGMTDKLMKMFVSYSWLKVKLERTDFFALLSEFKNVELDLPESVVQVYEALTLSGRVLCADKTQLGAQLLGRLTKSTNKDIIQLLQEVEDRSQVALHPCRQCLTAPGGPTIGTYNRLQEAVLCIAVTNALGPKRVFMGSADRTIRVWDLESCRDVSVLLGHHGDVTALAIRKDDAILASGSRDSAVRIWDADRLTLLCTLEGHRGSVNGVAFLEDGATLVSVSSDQTVKVWKLDALPEPQASNVMLSGSHLTPITSIIWPTTKDFEIETVPRTQLLSTSPTESDDARDLPGPNTWLCVSTLVGHTGEINGVCAFHHKNMVTTCSNDNTVRLWDLDSLQSHCLEGHEKAVLDVAITTDDSFLVSASGDRQVGVWDVDTRDLLHKLVGHTDMVAAIAITPDDANLVSGGGMDDTTIRIWKLREGNQVGTFRGHGEGIKALIAVDTEKGRMLLSGSVEATCRIWKLEDAPQDVAPLLGHDSPVYAVAISRKGRLAVSGSRSGELKLWNLHSGETEAVVRSAHSRSIRALAVSEDESMVVSGSKDRKVKIWDVSQDTETSSDIFRSVQPSYLFERSVLRGHVGAVQCVAISQDSKLVVSGGWDNLVFLWNVQKGRCARKFVHVSYGIMSVVFCKQSVVACARDNVVCRWDGLTAEDKTKRTVVRGPSARWLSYPAMMLPDEAKIVSGCPEDERYCQWDRIGRQSLGSCGHPIGSVLTALAVSCDGRTLVSASTAGTITSINLSTSRNDVTHFVTQKEVVARSELKKQTSAITILETGTEGHTVFLTGDVQGAVKMWRTDRGADVVRYVKDRFEVLGAALGQITSFCNLSRHLAVSGSGGGTLAVWDARERRRRDCWEAHDAVVTDVVTTDGGGRQTILSVPNTRLVLSASLDRTIKLWFVSASSYQPLHLMFLPRDCPPALRLATAPDGCHFVTGSVDNKLRAYDANTFELVKEYPSDYYGVNCVGFTADGREMMCSYSGGFLGVWDFNTGECVNAKRDNTTRRPDTWCHFSAVVPDTCQVGPIVVTGDSQNKVTVWDYVTGDVKHCLQVPNRKLRRCSQEVTCVTVTSDGSRIVSGSADMTLRVWAIAPSGETNLLCQFTFEHAPRAAVITDTGKICVGLSNGQVCFLQLKEPVIV
ncbi:apoptotic protease-activating factor 1-like [Branchiostoma floridae]|uniref:Apoptotic protease-activating factor 1-like n=1 Tax=Branchiostoma floridae TaxID=7739 RepID=A0A9J7MU01_BRAFL|nr:apoptotic protease-activating factor 1-like [Branchiostoma floridae]